MNIIDLKVEEVFISQYVKLRNSYRELLLSSMVTISETKRWIKRDDIEIRGIVSDMLLLGVVVLYLNKDGEITFFVKNRNNGIGSKLLKKIETVAKQHSLHYVWSWVLESNHIAKHVFEKEGFINEVIKHRVYCGKEVAGFFFRKYLINTNQAQRI